MCKFIDFKKLGDKWYVDLPHEDPNDVAIDTRFYSYLDTFAEQNTFEKDKFRLYLYEQIVYINPDGLIQFTEKDILRYNTTDDYFLMDLIINNHRYFISSSLFSLLDKYYELDLSTIVYRIDLSEYAIENRGTSDGGTSSGGES